MLIDLEFKLPESIKSRKLPSEKDVRECFKVWSMPSEVGHPLMKQTFENEVIGLFNKHKEKVTLLPLDGHVFSNEAAESYTKVLDEIDNKKIQAYAGQRVRYQGFNTMVTRGRMISNITYYVKQHVEGASIEHMNLLMTNLRDKGYIKQRGELDLIMEIKERKLQYPNSNIYLLMGQSGYDYLKNLYNLEKPATNNQMVEVHGAKVAKIFDRWSDKMTAYESAVVSDEQVSAAHSYESFWSCARLKRKIHVVGIMFAKFGLLVEPYKEARSYKQLALL